MLIPDSNYGRGVFRRRLRLGVAARETRVDLEDGNHAFRLVLRHDGERITAIEPTYVRHPFTTCPGSARFLTDLVGRPLDDNPEERRLPERRHSCTHVTDMARLALDHVRDAGLRRLYDIEVDDECEGRSSTRITCDGQLVHEWIISRQAIVGPEELAGRPMMQGFHAWVRQEFTDLALEAAIALQRGWFVGQTRRYIMTPVRDHPATGDGMPDGVCYSYSEPVVRNAERIEGSKRDFTHDADALLRFRH